MADYNRIILVGNLTRDPDYKQLPSGQGICKLGLAANRQFKNRQTGDMVQEVCFVDVDVWGPQADSCNQYLEKGRAVLVEGRLKLDSWQDAEGNNRSKHSIVADRVVFLSTANNEETAGMGNRANTNMNSSMNSNKISMPIAKKTEAKPVQPKMIDMDAEEIKPAKEQAAKAPKVASDNSEEVPKFKDEPPFQDDLPF